ncbi:MAG: glycosyl transferase group 1, partial [Oscillospiraceae bacterium]|nr:glycosyl transferase group 1 [Oscillospiraceae bacterium]
MTTINMLSKADLIKGQGVLSAHNEQVNLIKNELYNEFEVVENKIKLCDITHYHTINLDFFFSIPFNKMKGVTVGYVHFLPETLDGSIHLPPPIKKIFYKYVISFYKQMDYLVTVNPYFIDRLESYGINREKVKYIPNFVSSEQFYLRGDKKELRQKYHLDTEKFTVLCVGQLQKRKGIFDFVKIAKRMPDVQFLWVGDSVFGKISDGYEEIKTIKENPPKNVNFMGLIEREDMNDIYNLADVMFLPSYEELFPMTILESMNCQIPILLRDIDIYKGILFDFYLRATDNDGFISVIEQLQSDKDY